MKPPFKLPVKKIRLRNIENSLYHIEQIVPPYTKDQADYIVTAINSHEGLVELAEDLRSGLEYLRDTKTEPYGFGIDRLEQKLQALEVEKQ